MIYAEGDYHDMMETYTDDPGELLPDDEDDEDDEDEWTDEDYKCQTCHKFLCCCICERSTYTRRMKEAMPE